MWSGPGCSRRGRSRPSWSSEWPAAGRRRPRVSGTRRRRRPRPRASPTGPGTTPGASTSTCCCGGCASIRTSRPSWTGRSVPLRDHDNRAKPPPCYPPSRRTWRTRAARRRRRANSTLNRQTLYNRLARIGELLGTDLDDPQTVLALSLALRARRHVP
ncbi:helix-turn-helix domain-containing protein [Streptomyces thinghirensis]|nr:helix-turn-helix domain-containing protein [Streptomyces thinghirensis]